MPNWCMNSLQITASKENIEILAKKLMSVAAKTSLISLFPMLSRPAKMRTGMLIMVTPTDASGIALQAIGMLIAETERQSQSTSIVRGGHRLLYMI